MSTHTVLDTPVGPLTLVGSDDVLTGVYFRGHWTRPDRAAFGPLVPDAHAAAAEQLREYLAGERRAFDLVTDAGGTPFQRRVWRQLAALEFGTTTSYGALAASLGATAREVGAAVGANPLSIVVPCHRVVGAHGALTGYAGGLARKRFLLDLEQDRHARLF